MMGSIFIKPVLECFLSNLFMQDLAFVLDGWALEIILKHSKESFTRLAMLSRTAICCRMTPLQKAQVYILFFMIFFHLPFDVYMNPLPSVWLSISIDHAFITRYWMAYCQRK